MGYLSTLMRYKRWANRQLFSALQPIPTEALSAKRPIVFGSMIRTLNHTYAMDVVWQAHLLNKPHGFATRNPETCPDLTTLSGDQDKIDDWYVAYADHLSAADESQMVDFTFIGGGLGSMSRADILIHVVNHGTYHRGNVTGMLYDLAVTPPTTDYPVFLKSTGKM